MKAHLVDATLFFSPTSGGVRRYLLAKHAWLNAEKLVRHSLLVPGPHDCGAAGGIVEFASPRIGCGYRCPVRLPALRRRLTELAPDLVEAGDPWTMAWPLAQVAEQLGIPAVAFCHSDLISLARERFGSPGARAAARYLRALYARFDRILAPSRVVAGHLADAGIGAVEVQPLGVDPVQFHPARRDPGLRRRLGVGAATRLLVFAGRLAPEKNIGELIEVVGRLGDPYHLLIVGAARAARPECRVTLLPYESGAGSIAAILAACDALLHAGRQETFGLVALEAMACGLPVVAYAAGALPELVDAEVGVLAPPTGPASLAAAVEALFARPLEGIRAAARARVLERHTWEATFRRELRTYAALLGQGASSLAVLAPQAI